MQYMWLLSREPTLDDAIYNKIMETARAALPNFDFSKLIKDDQNTKKCKYVE